MRLVIALLVVLLLGACSDTETVYKRDGVCYSREVQRTFGVKVQDTQLQVDLKHCP